MIIKRKTPEENMDNPYGLSISWGNLMLHTEDFVAAYNNGEKQASDYCVKYFKGIIKDTFLLFKKLHEQDKEKLDWKFIQIIRRMGHFASLKPVKGLPEYTACVKITEFLLDLMADGEDDPTDVVNKEWQPHKTIHGVWIGNATNRNFYYDVYSGDMTDMLEYAELICEKL